MICHVNRRLRTPAVREARGGGALRSGRRARRPQEKSLLGYLGTTLSAVLFVFTAATVVLVVAAPLAAGGQPLTVLTNSMAPKLPPGTLIVIKPTPTRDITVGDVLTYQIESGRAAVISHRVVERAVNLEGETTFITKGDNNDVVDALPVREIQVRGKLWYAIPYLGWVNHAVNGEARVFVAPIVATLLISYAAITIVTSIRDLRKNRPRVEPAATTTPDIVGRPGTRADVDTFSFLRPGVGYRRSDITALTEGGAEREGVDPRQRWAGKDRNADHDWSSRWRNRST